MEKVEILAPVGSFDNLIVAINNGANAVYFGLPQFNARIKADNVTLEQLPEFVKLAHLHDVKCYLTINTLIKNEEVEQLLEFVKICVDNCVDAFIVQDLGIANILLNCFKNIELHASTQMGIHNLAGAKVIEKLGFKRVVLARETTLEDIVDIKTHTDLQIEYFVQGALCVGFSGNCYFSSLCNNKSGNRGECSQFCRLKYAGREGNKTISRGYLLSTTDICQINNLKELIKSGVSSLKIEGRLRRKGYIAQAVRSYYNVLNDITTNAEEIENLKAVFNRGDFNDAYLQPHFGKEYIINPYFQNHRGVAIGKVVNVEKFKYLNKISIRTKTKLNKGDGLKFVLNGNESSMGVGNIETKDGITTVISLAKPDIDSTVFRTLDCENESKLTTIKKFIPVSCQVEAYQGRPLKIKLQKDKISVEYISDHIVESAHKSSLTEQDIIEQIDKTQNVSVEFKEIKVFKDENIYLQKSQINQARRTAIELLFSKIIDKNSRKDVEYKDVKLADLYSNLFNSYTDLEKEEDVKSDAIYAYNPKDYSYNNIKKYFDNILGDKNTKKMYLILPNIATKADIIMLDNIIKQFKTSQLVLIAQNLYATKYIAKGYKVIGGYMLNITNNYAVKMLNDLGYYNFTRSIESYMIDSLQGGLTYVGKPSIMVMTHCPYKLNYNFDCTSCRFNGRLAYKTESGSEYKIERVKMNKCYFHMIYDKEINSNINDYFIKEVE